MDISTAEDMIEDLQLEREELLARIRRLENQLREVTRQSEYWQRLSASRD